MALGPGRMTLALAAALALHAGAAALLMSRKDSEGAQTPGSGGLGFGVATLGGSETASLEMPDPVETQEHSEPLEADTIQAMVEAATPEPELPVDTTAEGIEAAPPDKVEQTDQADTPPLEPSERVQAVELAPAEPVEIDTLEIAKSEEIETAEDIAPQMTTADPVEIVEAASEAAQPVPPRRPQVIPPAPPKPERRVVSQRPRQEPTRSARTETPRRQAAIPAHGGPAAGEGGQGGAGQAQTGGGDPAARRGYLAQIHAQIARNKRYPNAARIRRQQGEGVLRLTVNASGAMVAARLRRSTGHPALDNEILRMAARAAPFPRFPDGMGSRSVTVDIPVPFRLR